MELSSPLSFEPCSVTDDEVMFVVDVLSMSCKKSCQTCCYSSLSHHASETFVRSSRLINELAQMIWYW